MPRGRRRKIEVPTDTQSQFESGDAAEDTERRRREMEEREERERERLKRERTERSEQMEREETEEMTENPPRTDTVTDVESTQSRQKPGQMKSICLSDSDEETIDSLSSNMTNCTRFMQNSKTSKTFRNETVKLLSGLLYKSEECKRQVIRTQQAQVTTFLLSEATQATAGWEHILTIPDTQQVSTQAGEPSQVAAPQPPTVIVKVSPTTEVINSIIKACILSCLGCPAAWTFQKTNVCIEPNEDF